jgi:hypothetical protein
VGGAGGSIAVNRGTLTKMMKGSHHHPIAQTHRKGVALLSLRDRRLFLRAPIKNYKNKLILEINSQILGIRVRIEKLVEML